MREPLYVLDVASRPVGQLVGGRHDVSVECPVCKRPGVLHREARKSGVLFREYAHRISIDLDQKNEPVARASEICIETIVPKRPGDPSRGPKTGPTGAK